MSPRVVMSDLFGRSYSDLDGSVKNRVLDFIVKLQERPDAKGLDLKRPKGVTDPRIMTARVSDFWRAVVIELPNSSGYVLVAVKPHDDAYTYAEQLRYGVNEVTGALEVVDQAALNEAVSKTNGSASDVDGGDTRDDQPPILKDIRSRDLRQFGIAEDVAEHLVTLTDEEQLYTVALELPRLQGNAVADLAEGRSLDEVWEDLVSEQEPDIDTSDVLQALERPASRLSFTEGRSVEELRAVLEGDFKAWRVWLHPLQRRLANHTGWRGPFRVTGGAGTGKTVTALHRARHLAERAPDDDEPTILFTTFTKNLARTIESQLVELAGPQILRKVAVLHIDALVQRVLATADNSEARPRLVGDNDNEVDEAWRTALGQASESWDISFLRTEWTDVVLAQGIDEQATYLRTSRSGRGRRLSRPQRAELWSIFERFTSLLRANSAMTFTQAAARAATISERLQDSADTSHDATVVRYRHGIIDEAQDLHPAHWRLLRAVVEPGTDDLFIVGDAHQRIYGRPVVLSRLGIETRGRSRRLTVNYRTSREILAWSLRSAYGQAADDLEGSTDSLAGARSEFSGPEPVAHGFATGEAERAALVEQLRAWSAADVAWSDMAVAARFRSTVDEIVDSLRQASLPVSRVDPGTDESKLGDEVRVMTMHRIKGLEFRAVAVVGCGSQEMPPRFVRDLDGEDLEAAYARERSLLYVCGSRAREYLAISWTGSPSPLLPTAVEPS